MMVDVSEEEESMKEEWVQVQGGRDENRLALTLPAGM